jgi:hypothetical protein
MNRYTKKINEVFVVDQENIKLYDSGYSGDAIDKLAKFENMVEETILKQEELSKELEILRNKQQTKLYKFRELLTHKLINNAIITILERYKLIG